ncbi:hypothetical protein [Kosakonia sacchari]
MQILKILGLSLIVTLIVSACVRAAPTAEQWNLVPGSHNRDFQIHCYEGGKLIYGIYPRNGTSENQVARDIYVRALPDGRTQLSFLRGFISADKETTYLPAVTVSCEVNAK